MNIQKQNQQERTLFAQRQLVKKLQNEDRIKSQLLAFFISLSQQAENFIYNNFGPPKFESSIFELRTLLFNHYDLVYDDFALDVNFSDIPREILETGLFSELLARNKNKFSTETSVRQAGFINETNNKEISKAFIDSVTALAIVLRESGTQLNFNNESQRKFISETSSDMFLERAKNRINTIAITETQQPAETAKLNTAQSIALVAAQQDNEEGVVELPMTLKEWNTILDNRTRPAHAVADGQVVAVNTPFIVASEQLMAPGDTSMGASVGNVANCRCSARYLTV